MTAVKKISDWPGAQCLRSRADYPWFSAVRGCAAGFCVSDRVPADAAVGLWVSSICLLLGVGSSFAGVLIVVSASIYNTLDHKSPSEISPSPPDEILQAPAIVREK